jgi:NADPH:quinone reductase-like Zn-dependent oxidoreductase
VLPPVGLVPCSDGAGEVLAVGSGVREFSAGDRVVTHLSEAWQHGELGNEMQETALGGGKDGVLRKVVVLSEVSALRRRSYMTCSLPHQSNRCCPSPTA